MDVVSMTQPLLDAFNLLSNKFVSKKGPENFGKVKRIIKSILIKLKGCGMQRFCVTMILNILPLWGPQTCKEVTRMGMVCSTVSSNTYV